MFYYKGQWFDKPTDAIAYIDPDLYSAVQDELRQYFIEAESLNSELRDEIDDLSNQNDDLSVDIAEIERDNNRYKETLEKINELIEELDL